MVQIFKSYKRLILVQVQNGILSLIPIKELFGLIPKWPRLNSFPIFAFKACVAKKVHHRSDEPCLSFVVLCIHSSALNLRD